MNQVEVLSKICINLIALGVAEGKPIAFSETDVNDILISDDDAAVKLRQLNQIKSSLHEVLYAPPQK